MPSRQASSSATTTHRTKPHAPTGASLIGAKTSAKTGAKTSAKTGAKTSAKTSTRAHASESTGLGMRQSAPPAQEGYERDPNYGLISVLYHALKPADITTKYIEDARQTRDEELVEFFEEARAEQMHRAAATEVLLGSRLESAILEDDVEDELESDEDEEVL